MVRLGNKSLYPLSPLGGPWRMRLPSSRISAHEDGTPMWICEKLSQDVLFSFLKAAGYEVSAMWKNTRFLF